MGRAPGRLSLAALLVAALSPACNGSSGTGGAPGPGGGECLATGASCVLDGGNEAPNLCCSGLCPGHQCGPANVSFAASCAPGPCGGNPVGTWHVVAGCGAPPTCMATPIGAASGSLTITAGTAAGTYEAGGILSAEDAYCGQDESSSSSGLDELTQVGGGGMTYCVQGTSLWVFPTSFDSHVTAVQLSQ